LWCAPAADRGGVGLGRDNDITGVLDQTFSVEEEEFGQVTTHDLCEDGRNMPVTEENKKRYVQYVQPAGS
jgi:hypothetical protein